MVQGVALDVGLQVRQAPVGEPRGAHRCGCFSLTVTEARLALRAASRASGSPPKLNTQARSDSDSASAAVSTSDFVASGSDRIFSGTINATSRLCNEGRSWDSTRHETAIERRSSGAADATVSVVASATSTRTPVLIVTGIGPPGVGWKMLDLPGDCIRGSVLFPRVARNRLRVRECGQRETPRYHEVESGTCPRGPIRCRCPQTR